MLENISIKNVALIKSESISFTSGLNIISGETGAGKSMLLGSISFLLGEKLSKDFIRNGEEIATVEGLFYLNNEETLKVTESLGISVLEDRYILVSRTVNSANKSTIRINGKIVTIGMLREISGVLMDIHSQRENQTLLNEKKHSEILDSFCGESLKFKKEILHEKFEEYKEIQKKINEVNLNEQEKNLKLDMFKFQIDEIESANLVQDEEEQLFAIRKILLNMEKLSSSLNKSLNLLYDEENSAYDKLSEATNLLIEISAIDENQKTASDNLSNIFSLLEDSVREIRTNLSDLDIDDESLEDVESRLALIYKLRKKYGNSIKDILDYYNNIRKEMFDLEDLEFTVKKLEKNLEKLKSEILVICDEISKIRKENALKIEKLINLNLSDLGMNNSNFVIDFIKKENFNANGFDEIVFFISTNKGEPLKQLSKIASGGEMSRVMLAMKIVLSKIYPIDTFIFDEIDTGVSGRTAQKVAEKLHLLSKSHQILCITHLPQIAAMADCHILIKKNSTENETKTSLNLLGKADIENELARLLGGAKITESTITAATEMKKLADDLKFLK